MKTKSNTGTFTIQNENYAKVRNLVKHKVKRAIKSGYEQHGNC